MEQLVTRETKLVFDRFGIDMSFLEEEVAKLEVNNSYKKGTEMLQKIKVSNDIVGRGIQLMKEYNPKLSTSEE